MDCKVVKLRNIVLQLVLKYMQKAAQRSRAVQYKNRKAAERSKEARLWKVKQEVKRR